MKQVNVLRHGFELFYFDNGNPNGHGGPLIGIDNAIGSAIRYIEGLVHTGRTVYVEIRKSSTSRKPLAVVYPNRETFERLDCHGYPYNRDSASGHTIVFPDERLADFEILRDLCKPGTIIYTILRHVSRSGMLRHIDCYVIADGKPRFISGYVANVLDYPRSGNALKVSGCGMDMGFDVVHNLSYTLHGWDDTTDKAGYTLRQEWI